MNLIQCLQRTPRTPSDWFAWVRSGRADSRGGEEWVSWIDADPKHADAYAERELAWEFAADLRESESICALLRDVDVLVEKQRRLSSRPKLSRMLSSWPAGVAAAAVLAVAISTFFVMRRDVVEVSQYATAVGEQRTVALPDQSTVSLNTATQIRVLYSRATRRIDVVAGEALFEVGGDPARPFEVHAQQGMTTALGTEFDIRVEGAAVKVSVLEGTVAVAADETGKSGTSTRVPAGQSVNYVRGGPVSAAGAADSTSILGWKAHRIVFNDAALANALKEYNRYLDVPIVLGSPELGTRHINGVFRIGEEDAFLGALKRGMHVKVSKNSSQTVLSEH